MRYAASEDFQKLFTNNSESLYLLSFLLTAHPEKAEKCFVSGFDECADGNPVFLEWACCWARRIIVRNAIREMAGVADEADPSTCPGTAGSNGGEPRPAKQFLPFAGILRLRKFERFVVVLSVLERYSDAECSLLLGASTADVRQARKQAFLHMAESPQTENSLAMDSDTAAPAFRSRGKGVPA